jgi:hypothetical protein
MYCQLNNTEVIDGCQKCFTKVEPEIKISCIYLSDVKTDRLFSKKMSDNIVSDNIVHDDKVNHPSHYTQGKYEVADIIDGMCMTHWCEANILKYIFRYKYKNGMEDLKKCQWYLNRLISIVEKQQQEYEYDLLKKLEKK